MTTKTLSDKVIAEVLGQHTTSVEKLVEYLHSGYGFEEGVTAVGEWVFLASFRARNPQLGFEIDMNRIRESAQATWDGLITILGLDASGTRSLVSQLTLSEVTALCELVCAVSSLSHKQGAFYVFMRELGSDALFVPLGNLARKLRESKP